MYYEKLRRKKYEREMNESTKKMSLKLTLFSPSIPSLFVTIFRHVQIKLWKLLVFFRNLRIFFMQFCSYFAFFQNDKNSNFPRFFLRGEKYFSVECLFTFSFHDISSRSVCWNFLILVLNFGDITFDL